jgi:hypothetical protein
MGAHTGRCFRDRRRTTRRHARQRTAWRFFQRMAAKKFGEMPRYSFRYLSTSDKQRVVEGFEKSKRTGFRVRRFGRSD